MFLSVPISAALAGMVRADITSNLVAWYKLDEAAGTNASDSTGNGHNGSWSSTPTYGSGKIGGGVTLAAGETMSVGPLSSSLAWTLGGWFKASSSPGVIWDNHIDQQLHWDSNALTFEGENANSSAISLAADGVWHHVAITHDASNVVSIFVDGVFKYQSSGTVLTTEKITDGFNLVGSDAFSADDVRIYSRDLSYGSVSVGQTAGGDIAELFRYGLWHWWFAPQQQIRGGFND
jgi:hypothetical protein